MLKILTCMIALAACGLPEKNRCSAAADCLGDEACHGGVCQPMSHDACGPTRAACAPDATCSDASGGLACTCKAGYDGDGLACADVDECAAAPCATHATCTNAPGSFRCACDAAFTGDATSYCVPARFTKIAAAASFSCGLAADGGAYCWGHNTVGELGDGTVVARARPTQVGAATDWTDLDAHDSTACGLRADHSLWCWGSGIVGQLGDGKLVNERTPTQVISDQPGVGWKAVAVGGLGACGIHDNGRLACWGRDPVTGAVAGAPVAVDGNADWTAIAAGGVRCGIRGAGQLSCWGSSSTGELGLGATATQATPAQVGTDTWTRVAVGASNTCGIRSDSALLCWGNHPSGSAGLQYGRTPRQVGAATDWQAISVSFDGIAGVRGGVALAWGRNDDGQLGLPVARDIVEPTAVSGALTGWSAVQLGLHHGCGLANGEASCWGSVGEGNLGDGSSTALYTPTKIGGDRWTSVAQGPGTCGVRADGALMCWGYPSFAGAGFGTTDAVWAPTRVGTDTWSAVAGSSAVFPPSACALRDGKPYCWGDNSAGQLGLGRAGEAQLSPAAVLVPEATRWTEIAVSDHTCAITSDAKLWCWGANDLGQLGTGATSATVTTAPLAPLPGAWLHVAVGKGGLASAVTCGIQADHTLWCWGQDPVLATPRRLAPAQVGTEASWDAIRIGAAADSAGPTACALKLDGTLWCWGARLGDGTTRASATPVQVSSDTWKTVEVGNEICAVKADRTLWCWGNVGLLGDRVPASYDELTVPVTTPTQIGADTDWSTVIRGSILVPKTCATKLDGSLWCWGYQAAVIPGIVTTPVPIR